MRKSVVSIVLVVALLVVLLTPDPAQGWWRRRRRRRWRIRIRIPKLIGAYKAVAALGKRGAPLTGALPESDLARVVADVVAPCAKTADMTTVTATLAAKFDQSDANGDDILKGAELDSFNTFLGTYNACA